MLHSKKAEFDEVLALMERDGIKPDERTWAFRINYTSDRGRLQEMSDLLSDMIDRGRYSILDLVLIGRC
jgi:hypothetical protein